MAKDSKIETIQRNIEQPRFSFRELSKNDGTKYLEKVEEPKKSRVSKAGVEKKKKEVSIESEIEKLEKAEMKYKIKLVKLKIKNGTASIEDREWLETVTNNN